MELRKMFLDVKHISLTLTINIIFIISYDFLDSAITSLLQWSRIWSMCNCISHPQVGHHCCHYVSFFEGKIYFRRLVNMGIFHLGFPFLHWCPTMHIIILRCCILITVIEYELVTGGTPNLAVLRLLHIFFHVEKSRG